MEKSKSRDTVYKIFEVTIPLAGMGILSQFAFSKLTKKLTILSQGRRCADCGNPSELQGHHIVPIRWGGSDDMSNCVMLCAGCHVYWDQMTYQGTVYSGIRLDEVRPSQVADPDKWDLAIKSMK